MNRITLFAATALAVALIAPATSLAGGWATVGLSSLPEGAQPREAWVVDLTVLQHGRTPLEGVAPRVLIRGPGDGAEKAFVAKPTAEPGVYRANVVFPSAGRWTYAVDDDFSQVHELGSVRVGAGGDQAVAAARPTTSAPADSGGGVTLAGALGIALGAGVLAALLTAVLRRRGEAEAGRRMKDALVAGIAAAALAFAVLALAVGVHGDAETPRASVQTVDDSGRAVFANMGCGSCHTLAAAGSTGQMGPDLDSALEHHTRATLIAQITAPASSGDFSGMPTDFASRMSSRELDSLVDFLLAQR